MNPNRPNSPIHRRDFIKQVGVGSAVLGTAGLSARAADPGPRIRLGLIGCGGRSGWILNLFKKHGGYEIAALADYFEDRVNGVGDKFGVPANKRFTGLSGYKRLLEQDVDAVAILSPPWFHPEHAATAVAAGKNVYLAKPIAVDVPGCRRIEAAGQKATKKNRVFLVDFQTRTSPEYQAAAKLVHSGGLGSIITGDATYYTGTVGAGVDKERRADPSDPQRRLRAWVTDQVLSGDVIVEQNIHSLDVMAWLMGGPPREAYGFASRKRDFVGDCRDRFSLIFSYDNDVNISFSSKQVGWGFDDISCRVFGMDGYVDTHYFGDVVIKSREDFQKVKQAGLYGSGAQRNITTFHDSIRKKDFSNLTVKPSVISNLTCVLGRDAASQSGPLSWNEMMRRNKVLEFDTRGLKG